jgi:hypothetical protein
MAYTKCEICKDYHFDYQKCLPVFFITHEDYLGEDEKQMRGRDHEDAAERYAKYYNEESGEYSMMNGDNEIKVQVRAPHEQSKRTFVVTAEPSIDYSTKEEKLTP